MRYSKRSPYATSRLVIAYGLLALAAIVVGMSVARLLG
jgi:hypothetical protein